MLTTEQVIQVLKNDVDFHQEMEVANDNDVYGYYADRLQEMIDLLEDEGNHEHLALVAEMGNN